MCTLGRAQWDSFALIHYVLVEMAQRLELVTMRRLTHLLF